MLRQKPSTFHIFTSPSDPTTILSSPENNMIELTIFLVCTAIVVFVAAICCGMNHGCRRCFRRSPPACPMAVVVQGSQAPPPPTYYIPPPQPYGYGQMYVPMPNSPPLQPPPPYVP
ncbi:unnamed protein product [Cyprideis torosa]|uniref:Uncharacterized protein n=1 Tax=Cyprideis torosa TaxID=163714 RepID=A0A7R8W946_9CRUS|nr:unnamed protein product [Cyprideis torosa]CAG0884004.1 unnamed protein product [Cyprideis torosa]